MLFHQSMIWPDLLTLQRSRRGRKVCSWVRHHGRCGWWLPADSADTRFALVRSGTFPLAGRSQWWLLLEEPGRSLCDLPCGQIDWDRDPSVLALGEESDRAEVGRGHLHERKWPKTWLQMKAEVARSENMVLLANKLVSTSSYVVSGYLSACCDALCVLYADCLQHLVVVEALALAWAWALLQGHVGEGSLAVRPHRVEDHSLEARAVPVLEQFLLHHTEKKRKWANK